MILLSRAWAFSVISLKLSDSFPLPTCLSWESVFLCYLPVLNSEAIPRLCKGWSQWHHLSGVTAQPHS